MSNIRKKIWNQAPDILFRQDVRGLDYLEGPGRGKRRMAPGRLTVKRARTVSSAQWR